MIQEADAGPDPDLLRTGQLRGVVVGRLGWDGRVGRDAVGGEVCIVGQRGQWAAVEGEGDLDFRLVGVAVYEGGPAGSGFRHDCGSGSDDLLIIF